MGRCRDCKWWVREDDKSGRCSKVVEYMPDGFPEANAYITSDTDYGYVYLVTAPDFGCVQFTPKEEDSD